MDADLWFILQPLFKDNRFLLRWHGERPKWETIRNSIKRKSWLFATKQQSKTSIHRQESVIPVPLLGLSPAQNFPVLAARCFQVWTEHLHRTQIRMKHPQSCSRDTGSKSQDRGWSRLFPHLPQTLYERQGESSIFPKRSDPSGQQASERKKQSPWLPPQYSGFSTQSSDQATGGNTPPWPQLDPVFQCF